MKVRDGIYNDGHAYILNMGYGDVEYLPSLTRVFFSSTKMVFPAVKYFGFRGVDTNLNRIPNYAIVREYSGFSYQRAFNCSMSMTFEFDTTTKTLHQDISAYQMNGVLKISPLDTDKGCFPNLEIHLTRTSEKEELKAAHYSIYLVLICSMVIMVSMRILSEMMESPNAARKYSMVTILIMMTFDLFISWTHFAMGMSTAQNFHYFLFPALIFFMIFTIIDFRIVGMIWKYDNLALLDAVSMERQRQMIFALNFKIYMSQFLGFILLSHFVLDKFLILVISLAIFPQIMNQVIRGQYFSFEYDYNI